MKLLIALSLVSPVSFSLPQGHVWTWGARQSVMEPAFPMQAVCDAVQAAA